MRGDLAKRHHRRMAESSIGLVGHAAELGIRDLAGDERLDDFDRDLPIGPAEKLRDHVMREKRPGLGHVEAAIAGQPGQHHVAEGERGGFPASGHVTRQVGLQALIMRLKPLI